SGYVLEDTELHIFDEARRSDLALVVNEHHLANQSELRSGGKLRQVRVQKRLWPAGHVTVPLSNRLGRQGIGKPIEPFQISEGRFPSLGQIHQHEKRRATSGKRHVARSRKTVGGQRNPRPVRFEQIGRKKRSIWTSRIVLCGKGFGANCSRIIVGQGL